MLSETWSSLRGDGERRARLFRGMARVMLSLAKVPFQRIGSLTIDHHGIASHTNRPLTLELERLENAGIPTDIPKDLTYNTTDAYLLDLLRCQDNRLRYMTNSILNRADGIMQLSALTMARTVLGQLYNRPLRSGPFVMQLTDLHASNIFVSEDWDITAIIDLEWACTLPMEMLHPPYWLTAKAIDDINGEDLEEFECVHAEFVNSFEAKERTFGHNNAPQALLMRSSWQSRIYWLFGAMTCLSGFYTLFADHVRPRYIPYYDTNGSGESLEDTFDRLASAYWSVNTSDFIDQKLKGREEYRARLKDYFAIELAKHANNSGKYQENSSGMYVERS